jgi:hypothetical protein
MEHTEDDNKAAGAPSALNVGLGLMPCPFCGGEPEMLRKGNDHTKKRSITIRCPDCRVERTDAALIHSMAWLEELSTRNWNVRPNAIIQGPRSGPVE